MEGGNQPESKRMRLRYAGTCSICSVELPARTEAIYDRSSKTVRCLTHEVSGAASTIDVVSVSAPALPAAPEPETGPELDIGTPGASARREYDRRKAGRESRVRAKHPRLGGLILAMTEEPQSTTAWDTGAVGEESLGRRLNELATDSLRVIHDRRVPGTRTNIDHLAVTPTGVWVIDAKRYRGRPDLKIEGGIVRPRVERLLVGRRDCTKVVDGVLKQIDVVRGVLGDDLPVHGALCFIEADWPLIGGSFSTRGVRVLWPKKLYPMLREPGPVDDVAIHAVHHRLAGALPAA